MTELTKKCQDCGGEVPESTRIPCPLCGGTKGFAISRTVLENVSISDEAKRTLERITNKRVKNKKANRVSLIIFAVSVIVASVIPTTSFFQPFAILIAVILGAIPLFYVSYHTETIHLIDRG